MVTKKYNKKYFSFEQRSQKPISSKMFIGRLSRYFLAAFFLVMCALGIGILGYYLFEKMSLTDAFLNASMILGGMGPVNEIQTEAGKIFAGTYALFSGLIFLVAVSLVFSPIFHRLLHRFHFEVD